MHQDWPVGPEFASFRSKFKVTGVLIGPIWTWNGPFEDLLGPSGPCWLRRGSNWTHIIEMHQDWPVRPDFASLRSKFKVTGVLIGPIWTWNCPFEDLLSPGGPCWLRRDDNWTHIIEIHQDWPVGPEFASFRSKFRVTGVLIGPIWT